LSPAIERYLEQLDHEEVLLRRGHRSGLLTIVAVHSTARGPSLGGCRMWEYADSRAALRDALRLSRAMTYKAAVADLSLGGGKGVIMVPPGTHLTSRRRRDALLDFADTVEAVQGRYITAEDVGTSSRDMHVIAERTGHVAGLARRRGGSGDPSPLTALGVETAIRAACAQAFGSPSLKGRSVCVIGLGHVGSRVARRCTRGGANVMISDLDRGKRGLADGLGARWVTPSRALFMDVDVLVPCALGGVFDDLTVPKLRCPVIAGAANNQLAGEVIGDVLSARGILWAPDFVVNAGGIINISVELSPDGYSPAAARQRVRGIGDTLAEIFSASARNGTTPLAEAMALARRRLRER
jgi:leucine dehydrogenase